MRRHDLFFIIGLLLTLAIGCQQQADGSSTPKSAEQSTAKGESGKRGDSQLATPATLPSFGMELPVWSVSRRARMLLADATTSIQNGKLKAALGPLTEATQLDSSLCEARLGLARLYALDKQPKVARDILRPFVDNVDTCGGCVESLLKVVKDEAFTEVLSLDPALKKAASKNQLPWKEWALQVSSTMIEGTGKLLPRFIHPREPFVLVRSCPSCSNPARRKAAERELFGPYLAVKVASRFNTAEKRFAGTRLRASAAPKRVGRCLEYTVPDPVPVASAAIKRLCFRPVTLDRSALTRVEIVYGRTKADVVRELKNNPKKATQNAR